jgi:multicomponent Na+:H+ antiporter subunit D
MTAVVVFAPVVIPLLAAAGGLAVWRRPAAARLAAALGSVGLLTAAVVMLVRVAASGPLAAQAGGWPAPFGITLVADMLAALMVLVSALVGLAVVATACLGQGTSELPSAAFPMLMLLLAGVCGAFLTGDLFNLFVWFEVLLIASFVLMVADGRSASRRAAVPYVVFSLLGSALFLTGVGLTYGLASTLSMADLAVRLPAVAQAHPLAVSAVAALLMTSFAIKAGTFPLFYWLPASYPAPPAAVAALFAGLLTKVGVYALVRVGVFVLPPIPGVFAALLVVAGLTMVLGVLGAVGQTQIRRILSFHIISQIGYMVMALGLVGTADPTVRRLAVVGLVFYVVHHIIVKSNLFLIGGVVRQLRGTEQLARLGGLVARPYLAALFLVPALSLAGLPPLSGFWAKLVVLRAGLEAEAWLVVAAAVVAGLLTLVSMTKIWSEAFWKPASEPARMDETEPAGRISGLTVPIAALALVTVAIGLYPQLLLELAGVAADQLLEPHQVLDAVGLGGISAPGVGP